MFSTNKRGARRVSSPVYKLLLATHITVSVGWLGVVAAKLILEVAAVTSGAPEVSGSLYESMRVLNNVFPPAAIATIVTGVLLSLGTKWGLIEYYWVAAKLALTVGVITTGVLFVDGLIRQSLEASSSQANNGDIAFGIGTAPVSLGLLSVAHVLMLGAATFLSVYKPWGSTRLGKLRVKQAK